MALPALTWRLLPVQSLGTSSTVTQILDAIWTAFGSTSYANGDARSAGSGVAWTMTRSQSVGVTQAVYGGPPTNPINQQVIIAGLVSGSPSPAPTMAPSCNAFVNASLVAGISKNSGAFTTFNAALPFGIGSNFSGYVTAQYLIPTAALSIRCYESADGVLVTINSGTVCNLFYAGGLLDPETGNTTLDAESDGKVYIIGCGQANQAATNLDGGTPSGITGDSNMFALHQRSGGLSNNPKCLAFTPGSGTMLGLARKQRYVPSGTSFSSRSGKYGRMPIVLDYTDTTLSWTQPTTTFAGRLREICFTRNAVGGTTLRNGANDVGYYISDSITTSGGSFILSY